MLKFKAIVCSFIETEAVSAPLHLKLIFVFKIHNIAIFALKRSQRKWFLTIIN